MAATGDTVWNFACHHLTVLWQNSFVCYLQFCQTIPVIFFSKYGGVFANHCQPKRASDPSTTGKLLLRQSSRSQSPSWTTSLERRVIELKPTNVEAPDALRVKQSRMKKSMMRIRAGVSCVIVRVRNHKRRVGRLHSGLGLCIQTLRPLQ
jgi:hypothetical protein